MNSPRILLVEDNEVNRYLAQFLLERAGFVVDTAADGQLALDCARRQRPDLVLMDMRMPVMDGLEATRQFKADPALSGIPVVALSAHAMSQEKAQALAAGCVSHIEKPIDATCFADQVRALLPPPAAAVGST